MDETIASWLVKVHVAIVGSTWKLHDSQKSGVQKNDIF